MLQHCKPPEETNPLVKKTKNLEGKENKIFGELQGSQLFYINVCVYVYIFIHKMGMKNKYCGELTVINATSKTKLVCEAVNFHLGNCYHVLSDRKQGEHINKEQQHKSVNIPPG